MPIHLAIVITSWLSVEIILMNFVVLQYIIFYLLLFLAPFLFMQLGERALRLCWWLVSRQAKTTNTDVNTDTYPLRNEYMADWCIHTVMGLLVWSCLTLLFFCIPISLPYAAGIPFLLLFFGKYPRPTFPFARDPHFLLWFIAHLVLGVSLISSVDGFQTSWRNNYGDLGFHVGSIFRLVFGSAGFPDYHVYAGEAFTYPFFINLWTAAHLSVFPMEDLLAPIFVMQWVLLWSLAYGLLRGNVRPLLPWAVLLLGGSYSYLFVDVPDVSAVYFPALLSTIWVPQRSSIFGLVVLCAVIALHHRMSCAEHSGPPDETPPQHRLYFASLAAAVFLSMAIFAHTIFALWGMAYLAYLQLERCFGRRADIFAAILFVLCLIFVAVCSSFLKSALPLEILIVLLVSVFLALLALACSYILRTKQDNSYHISLFCLVWFLCGALLSTPFVSLLLGKASMLSLVPAWVYNLSPIVANEVISEAWTKLFTDGIFFVAPPLLALLLLERYSAFFSLFAFFLLSQVLRMAVWEFDQNKAILAVLILMILVWAWTEHKHALSIQFLAIILVIPTLFELGRIIREAPLFTVFSKEQIEEARPMRALLPKESILASSPEVHNGTALLTGRPLFLGYRGTVWTHALSDQPRLDILRNIEQLAHCPQNYAFAELCPKAIVYDESARQFWDNQQPPEKDWIHIRTELWMRRKVE